MGFFDGAAGGIFGGAISGVASLIGGHSQNENAWKLAQFNAANQKEFAQNSIKWRVEDAKRAGVHPMAALGITPSSFSPVSANFSDYSGVASAIKDMGQNIDRAALVAKDQEAQNEAKAFTDTVNQLTLEKMGLENDVLRAEIASKQAMLKQAQTPPAPKVNVSAPFGDQLNAPPPVGSQPPSGGIDTFTSDPASMFQGVVVGDSIIPVFHPDIADPLSESIHSSSAAKLAYVQAVNNREILGPPRSTWSASQKRRVDNNTHHWVFDALKWKWYLRENPKGFRSSDGRSVSGPLQLFHPSDYR